jgi:hypothetical protein
MPAEGTELLENLAFDLAREARLARPRNGEAPLLTMGIEPQAWSDQQLDPSLRVDC